MKRLLLLATAALAVFAGCNRSGVIDDTASAGDSGTKSAAPARIAHGQRVDLQAYVVPGKTTIFDFTSEYCPPCRAIAPALHKLHASRSDIVVVEVDLNRPGIQGIDWESPVAQQYNMRSIPAFKVYGADGKLQVEGDEASSYVTSLLQ
jgi:thiol-disulfide isomerase/thioredoxin